MQTLVIDQSLQVRWYMRLANVVIDWIVILLFFIILAFIAAGLATGLGLYGLAGWMQDISDSEAQVMATLMITIYYITMEIATQRTVGKYITGTIVVSENGGKPSAKAIIGRSLCRIFSIEALSFIAFYPRGWHDSASGTYVVDTKKYKAALELNNSFDQIGLAPEL